MPTKKSGDSQKKPNRAGRAVTLWLSADVFAALEQWRKAQPVKPVRTAIIEKSLVLFLRSQGIDIELPEDD